MRVSGNEAREGRNKTPPRHMVQYESINRDKNGIEEIKEIIRNAKPDTNFNELPTTGEIARAYGYDPEKYCPTCYRKFKRHATRKRIGDHKHYPIFAVCNPAGKNPGNVWDISTKAHYGNEHFAIDKFNIFDILKRFLRDISLFYCLLWLYKFRSYHKLVLKIKCYNTDRKINIVCLNGSS
jgi:hypothetical protein